MAGLTDRVATPRAQWGLMLRLHFLLLKRQATASPGRKFVMAVLVILGAVASVLLGFTAFAGMVVGRMRMNLPEFVTDEAVHLAFALVLVWLAGIGRYWDHPNPAPLQRLGLGSVVYVFALSLLLWLIARPLATAELRYVHLLSVVCLTAPLAFLYAIPVERFLTLEAARSVNVGFLAVVASWRVAIYTLYLRRWAGLRALSQFGVPPEASPLSLAHLITAKRRESGAQDQPCEGRDRRRRQRRNLDDARWAEVDEERLSFTFRVVARSGDGQVVGRHGQRPLEAPAFDLLAQAGFHHRFLQLSVSVLFIPDRGHVVASESSGSDHHGAVGREVRDAAVLPPGKPRDLDHPALARPAKTLGAKKLVRGPGESHDRAVLLRGADGRAGDRI